MMYVISTFLPYFFLIYFNFFENSKFRRNFLKFTAGTCFRLITVSVNFSGYQPLSQTLPAAPPSMTLVDGAPNGRPAPPVLLNAEIGLLPPPLWTVA